MSSKKQKTSTPIGAPYKNITSGEVVYVTDVVWDHVQYTRTTPVFLQVMKNIGKNEMVRIDVGAPLYEFQKPTRVFYQTYRPLAPVGLTDKLAAIFGEKTTIGKMVTPKNQAV